MASVLSPLTSLTTRFGCRDTQSNACGDPLLPLLGSHDLVHDLVRCVGEVADGVLGQALILLRLQGVAHVVRGVQKSLYKVHMLMIPVWFWLQAVSRLINVGKYYNDVLK